MPTNAGLLCAGSLGNPPTNIHTPAAKLLGGVRCSSTYVGEGPEGLGKSVE